MTRCNPFLKLALLLPALAAVGACGDALVYGESTNFSLASIKVNDNVAQPFSVNFALDRTVATLVPPMSTGDEAANMISRFRLDDTSDSAFGTKTITTEFASGQAAESMATHNVAQALVILDAAEYAEDKYTRCIDAWINKDDSGRAGRLVTLNTWWKDTGHKNNSGLMRNTANYAAEREQFVAKQKISCE